ncbi:MAG: hypothetical protein AUI84_07040 [Delftia sp. 13_1_40CM_3_66_6]|nr:MAG: hypothetical protein AUI84_07040 [Delftia sp. 13_1_40CM_3_66_6]
MINPQEQIRRALSFFAFPAIKALAQAEVTYERDCLELYDLIGPPLSIDQLKAIVMEVAYQSTHKNSDAPGHLAYLLKNKWYVESSASRDLVDALDRVFNHPVDCSEKCLAKFLELRERTIQA